MIVREIGIFPVVHYKHAVNSMETVIDRQHLIKFILLLLCLIRKGGDAFGCFEDIFPRTYNMSSGISEYTERGMLKQCYV